MAINTNEQMRETILGAYKSGVQNNLAGGGDPNESRVSTDSDISSNDSERSAF